MTKKCLCVTLEVKSRVTLLYSIVDGYEKQEVSGKYYLKIIEMWTDESIETSRIFDDLNSEMELSDFLKSTVEKRYGLVYV